MELVSERYPNTWLADLNNLTSVGYELCDCFKTVKQNIPSIPKEGYILVNTQLIQSLSCFAYLSVEIFSTFVFPWFDSSILTHYYSVESIFNYILLGRIIFHFLTLLMFESQAEYRSRLLKLIFIYCCETHIAYHTVAFYFSITELTSEIFKSVLASSTTKGCSINNETKLFLTIKFDLIEVWSYLNYSLQFVIWLFNAINWEFRFDYLFYSFLN